MIIIRKHFAIVSLLLAVVSLVGGLPTDAAANGKDAKGPYKAHVRWTSFGIPHVRASNWGGLGYGYGYAFARDNVCTLAEDVVESTGQLSRFFGRSAATLRATSCGRSSTRTRRPRRASRSSTATCRSCCGATRPATTAISATPACPRWRSPAATRPWVRPITEIDMLKVLNKLTLRAGVANFINALVGAAPPAPATAAIDTKKAAPTAPVGSAAEAQRLLAQTDLPTWDVHAFGSNAVALGRDLTNDGQGALLGNPHFPWFGISRFHAVHLTIPGRYDAMGAAIYGFPLVSIGFNRFVAWSHTVSTARRFVVRELTLAPGDPTSYVYDGVVVPMTPETVIVDVLQTDGSHVPMSHTFYLTQFGPMMILPPLAFWTTTTGTR